jgi:hypothetical protein
VSVYAHSCAKLRVGARLGVFVCKNRVFVSVCVCVSVSMHVSVLEVIGSQRRPEVGEMHMESTIHQLVHTHTHTHTHTHIPTKERRCAVSGITPHYHVYPLQCA